MNHHFGCSYLHTGVLFLTCSSRTPICADTEPLQRPSFTHYAGERLCSDGTNHIVVNRVNNLIRTVDDEKSNNRGVDNSPYNQLTREFWFEYAVCLNYRAGNVIYTMIIICPIWKPIISFTFEPNAIAISMTEWLSKEDPFGSPCPFQPPPPAPVLNHIYVLKRYRFYGFILYWNDKENPRDLGTYTFL